MPHYNVYVNLTGPLSVASVQRRAWAPRVTGGWRRRFPVIILTPPDHFFRYMGFYRTVATVEVSIIYARAPDR
jgi:hypothetical protein